jgi:hypothetical protein
VRPRPLKFDLPPYKGKNADNDLKLLANENNYKVVQVEKDGNCLFRAVSKSVSLNLNIQYTHTELRIMVVDFLKNNKNFLEPYIDYILGNDNDQSYIEKDKYIQNMARPGVWGDFICLLVLSEILKVVFKVLILNTQTFQRVSNKDVYKLVVPIGFIDEYHYTALIPVTRDQMPMILTPSVVPPPSVMPPSSVPPSSVMPPSSVPPSSVMPPSSIAPKIPPPIFDKTKKPLSSVNELLEIMDKVKPYIYDDISQLNKAERQIMVSLGM